MSTIKLFPYNSNSARFSLLGGKHDKSATAEPCQLIYLTSLGCPVCRDFMNSSSVRMLGQDSRSQATVIFRLQPNFKLGLTSW